MLWMHGLNNDGYPQARIDGTTRNVRKFIFDFWAETGRAPNLRHMHEGTGLARRRIVQALKLLQTGIVVVVDQDSPNCDILKAPPFSVTNSVGTG